MISEHWLHFTDSPRNPLIDPPRGTWLIGDPTVLAPCDGPDGSWHLFCNTITALHHYTSADGYEWTERGGPLFKGIRACVRRFEERFVLFYETFLRWRRRGVALRISTDLENWSEPQLLLEPSLPWEGLILPATTNPCWISGDFGHRLYFSAANIVLWDTFVIEPRHIGMAESDELQGPYRKRPLPILSPSRSDPYANLGAGAIKVYADGDRFVGFQNGVYRDPKGRSRSAIRVLESTDGIRWSPVGREPLIAPEPDGWKRGLVYQLDVVRFGNEHRLYYNARDGWRRARERIGVAISR